MRKMTVLLVKKIVKAAIILCLLLLNSISLQTAFAADDTNSGQQIYIGFKRVDINIENDNKPLPLALVYPSSTQSKSVKFGPFEMELAIGGEIIAGQFPLVVISHGSGGSNIGHRSIAFELVRNGFIVAMPLHPKNNFRDNSAEGTLENWVNRPRHIDSTIDWLLEKDELSNSIDENNIAIIGHSAGGYTALAVAGGDADTIHIKNLCLNNLQINDPFCKRRQGYSQTTQEINNEVDQRIKALVLMAPVGVMFQSSDALDEINIPVLIFEAEKDLELTEPYHARRIAQNLKSKQMLTYCRVINAGHYSFITPFPDFLKNELGDIAKDPEGFERPVFHEQLSIDIVNYLKAALGIGIAGEINPSYCAINEFE